MDKCAQYGVDPGYLLKQAARGDYFMKTLQELIERAGNRPMLKGIGSFGIHGADKISPRLMKSNLNSGLDTILSNDAVRGIPPFSTATLLADQPVKKALLSGKTGSRNLAGMSQATMDVEARKLAERLKEMKGLLDNL